MSKLLSEVLLRLIKNKVFESSVDSNPTTLSWNGDFASQRDKLPVKTDEKNPEWEASFSGMREKSQKPMNPSLIQNYIKMHQNEVDRHDAAQDKHLDKYMDDEDPDGKHSQAADAHGYASDIHQKAIRALKVSPAGNPTHRESYEKILAVADAASKRADSLSSGTLSESVTDAEYGGVVGTSDPKNFTVGKTGARYDPEFHDHPDVKPIRFTKAQKEALRHYCMTSSYDYLNADKSSASTNSYLRNTAAKNMLGANPDSYIHEPEFHEKTKEDDSRIKQHIADISSAFKTNANRTRVILHSGLPSHIGKQIQALNGGSIHNASFISASSERRIANVFADKYHSDELDNGLKNRTDPTHRAHFVCDPGTAVSVAKEISEFKENEEVLDKDLHLTHIKSEYDKENNIWTHHILVRRRTTNDNENHYPNQYGNENLAERK